MSIATIKAILLRKEQPTLSAAEIGRQVGLSKQRTGFVLLRAGLPFVPRTSKVCACGRPKSRKAPHCRECQKEQHSILLICPRCQHSFKRKIYEVRGALRRGQQEFYCSRKCFHAAKYRSRKINSPPTEMTPEENYALFLAWLEKVREWHKSHPEWLDDYLERLSLEP